MGAGIVVETGTLPPDGVRVMFDRIAPVYDAMNRVMTVGLDRRWRELAAEVVLPGDRVLDACCGTGDLALAARRRGGVVTGLDFSAEMLERARRKSAEVTWVQGDLLALPFEDGSFESATVGFGVRNVADLPLALCELRRVLVPGGRVAVLEITQPRGLLAPFYRLWFDAVVPFLGRVLPGGAAYTYLPASVRRFPGPGALAELLGEAGFASVRYRLLAGSIVALHTGAAA
jgi:demethylmenaquinone methyltransferase / 2-methoxy-6-polyprenyl-1,4-benzoquinol methylase